MLKKIFSLLSLLAFALSGSSALADQANPLQYNPADTPPLEQMLGSMLMFGFRGASLAPDDPFLQAVAAGKIGNVVLFDRDVTAGGERNITSPEQLSLLTASLKSAARSPVFIAVDQEGGQVRRLKPQKGFMDLPSAQRMGQQSVQEVRRMAENLGEELANLGINCDLAPVADVDTNPFNPGIGRLGRAFSADATVVAAHALAFGQGLAKKGVVPVLKHFPGQGCAKKDTHEGLADISQCWNPDVDLLPYAEIFRAGWPGMVMVGHLFCSQLDGDMPATLSPTIINGLLRDGLGWQGVVISDDMQMQPIADKYDIKEAIMLAVLAGNDILLFGNNMKWDAQLPQKAWNALKSLVDEGIIEPDRIKESWRRINALHQIYENSRQQDAAPIAPAVN